MLIGEIIKNSDVQYDGDLSVEISDVTCDSRSVKKGSLFFCITGFKSDGHDFAKDAVNKGAAALVVSRRLDIDVPQILVKDEREAMAKISAEFFGRPFEDMTMVGVTGTNGKTTTTYLCANIAKSLGKKVGIIGTICNYILDEEISTKNTTPESVELMRLLAKMRDKGVEIVFMEVSSHSLYLKRVFGIDFDIGVFTNLTQDHLDFHGDMENYAKAKAVLFENSKVSIINGDDGFADVMKGSAKGKVITYGLDNKNDIGAFNIVHNAFNNEFDLNMFGNTVHTKINIPGRFSIYNGLCAAAVCHELGYDTAAITKELESTKGVNGRCQVLKSGEYTVILDYAHTPDGLLNILNTFKGMGRLVCLFGCGGDRDPKKRPIMGRIAGEYSDFVILTSDNPRTEDPMAIIEQTQKGLDETGCPYVIIENRKDAIKYSIDNAKAGDIIVLAGKGHETYQEINGVRYDFDEKKIVAELLK